MSRVPTGPDLSRLGLEKQGRGPPSAPTFPLPERPATYYSPPPSPPPDPAASPQKNRRWQMAGLGVLAAAILAVGAWQAFTPAVSPQPASAPLPAPLLVAAAPAQAKKTLMVSNIDADYKATEYLKALWAGATATAPPAADALRAVNAPALKAMLQTAPQTATAICTDRCLLYRLYCLDFLDEDGDQVELFVDGMSYGQVYLKNAGQEFLIPLVRGKPAELKILATVDGGGGGVTFGMVSSLGEARTRIMEVGESEQWQVAVQ